MKRRKIIKNYEENDELFENQALKVTLSLNQEGWYIKSSIDKESLKLYLKENIEEL